MHARTDLWELSVGNHRSPPGFKNLQRTSELKYWMLLTNFWRVNRIGKAFFCVRQFTNEVQFYS